MENQEESTFDRATRRMNKLRAELERLLSQLDPQLVHFLIYNKPDLKHNDDEN